jgi:uncharacterized protein YciI
MGRPVRMMQGLAAVVSPNVWFANVGTRTAPRGGRRSRGMAGARPKVGGAAAGQSGEERVRHLTERMLRKKLYVVLSSANRGSNLKPHLADHLEYMIGLEKKGLLFASGPFSPSGGGAPGDGMTILRTESLKQARAIAARDPFVLNGLRTFELREWTLNEGSLGITVNLSDQTVDVA